MDQSVQVKGIQEGTRIGNGWRAPGRCRSPPWGLFLCGFFLGPRSAECCWFGPIPEITRLSDAAGRGSDTAYVCGGVQDKNVLAGNCAEIFMLFLCPCCHSLVSREVLAMYCT